MSIYEHVASLVVDAVSDTLSASSEFEYSPPPIIIPATAFTATIAGAVPSAPTYTPSPPPKTTLSGSLDRASYNAASAVIGALEVGTLPTTLEYLSPVRPEALPNLGTPELPGDPPQTGFVSVLDSAGLSAIESPSIVVGMPPDLEPIPRLSYDTMGLAPLSVTMPVPGELPTIEQLSNPDELVVVLDPRLLAAIQHTLSGQDIMSVQQELYNLATHDVRRERVDAERKLFADSAARGFGDANGPLFERLADLNYAARFKDGESYEQGRDLLYDAAKRKLVVAVQQAIALETANFAVHMAYASKLVEVFEINAALHGQIFNILLEMFAAQVTSINSIIDAYNIYIGVVLAEQQAEMAELDAVRAVLQTNKARVTMYQAQAKTASVRAQVYGVDIEQATLPVEEYTAYIDGLMHNVDIQQENLRAYKDSLKAFSDASRVDKAAIDAYGAQIRAEGSAVDVYRENWDLYSAAHTALSGQNSSVGEFNRASLQALTSEISVFQAAAGQQGAYLRGLSTWLDQKKTITSDYMRGAGQFVEYLSGRNRTLIDLEEASTRVELAHEDLATTQEALDAQRDGAQATIDAGLLASNATTYAGMANAAYAVRSVSASLDSSSSDSDSQEFSSSATESNSYSKSYSYRKTASSNV